MTDTVTFTIQGVEALQAKLNSVKKDVQFKGGRFALRKAANLIAKKAKEGAKRLDDPKSAADIEKNIAVRWSGRTFKQNGNLMFRVGVMGGAGGTKKTDAYSGLPGKDTRHWRQLEFGNQNMRARPFMRPALAENTSAAVDEFMIQYGKSIDRAIKKGS